LRPARFEIHDRALHLLRAFATSRNVHVTLVIHPRKEDDAVPLSIRCGAPAGARAPHTRRTR